MSLAMIMRFDSALLELMYEVSYDLHYHLTFGASSVILIDTSTERTMKVITVSRDASERFPIGIFTTIENAKDAAEKDAIDLGIGGTMSWQCDDDGEWFGSCYGEMWFLTTHTLDKYKNK